jgi:hypothetical protein
VIHLKHASTHIVLKRINHASFPIDQSYKAQPTHSVSDHIHKILIISTYLPVTLLNTMSPPITLSSLTPREAIADALSRCVSGLDTNSRPLFESACLKDETMTFAFGPTVLQGWPTFSAFTERAFRLITTHVISNIRIAVEDGADTATLWANAISIHVRPEDALKVEDTSYTAGSLYDIELVRDDGDGLWKIKRWDVEILWTKGDKAIVQE